MYKGILHTHVLTVVLFLLLYVIKTIMLLMNKKDTLQSFSKKSRVPEMIISTLFLLTGIYLAFNSGNIGTWFYVKIVCVLASIPIAIVAFKKMNKTLAVLSILLIVYVYGISETKSPTFKKADSENDFANTDPSLLGKTIYESQCISCHGTDGKLGLSGAKDLTASALSHDEKINVITNGKNAMQSYKGTLTEQQILAVTDFVEALKETKN